MFVGESVPEEEILLAFALSEMFSRRWAEGLANCLPEAVAERVRYAPRSEWSEDDRKTLLDAVRTFRPPLLDPLLGLGASWSAASLTVTDLPGLRVVSTKEFQGLAPDGCLATLVASIDRGGDTPDAEFSGSYRRVKSSFSPTKMQGRPCLIAKVREGPYTVLEGLTRLAVLQSRASNGKSVPDPLEVYSGVTDRLDAWGSALPPHGAYGPPHAPGPVASEGASGVP